MSGVLVDTDVFVDHLRGHRRLDAQGDTVHFSVVTRCELCAGPPEQDEAVRVLLAAFEEVPVDARIAELAGRLRRQTGVRTPDALIAATALTRALDLMTRNLRDFEAIPKLTIRAPRARPDA